MEHNLRYSKSRSDFCVIMLAVFSYMTPVLKLCIDFFSTNVPSMYGSIVTPGRGLLNVVFDINANRGSEDFLVSHFSLI